MLSDPGRPATPSNAAAWPALDYEMLPWRGDLDAAPASRTQRKLHQGPYRAAVPPSIARLDLDLPTAALAAAEDTAREIARFDAELGREIAPFATVLLRSESAASSRIENLTASARAIAEAEVMGSGRRNATEIVANTRAMHAAIALADRLDADSILSMHHALMDGVHPEIAGRWREAQVWIGGTSLGPHGAMFVPPHHARVPEAIDDLIAYIARDDIPVLPHAAIAHAQFETIHPFPDGNGRTGRALLHAMLRNKGLTRNVTVPMSAGLLANTNTYFEALEAYRRGDLSPMVQQVSDAGLRAVANGERLVQDLRTIRDDWNARVDARRDSTAWRLADLLIRHPVVNAHLISQELGVRANNAYRPIQPFERAGILVEFTDQRRNRAWRSPQVLAALDAFAARAGRRGP